MFVGVIVENFHKCRENQEKEDVNTSASQNAQNLDRKQRSKWSTETLLLVWITVKKFCTVLDLERYKKSLYIEAKVINEYMHCCDGL